MHAPYMCNFKYKIRLELVEECQVMYYLYLNCQDCVGAHKTSLTLPLFIEVPVPSHQEWCGHVNVCWCIQFTFVSTIFKLDVGIGPKMWYYYFFFPYYDLGF